MKSYSYDGEEYIKLEDIKKIINDYTFYESIVRELKREIVERERLKIGDNDSNK